MRTIAYRHAAGDTQPYIRYTTVSSINGHAVETSRAMNYVRSVFLLFGAHIPYTDGTSTLRRRAESSSPTPALSLLCCYQRSGTKLLRDTSREIFTTRCPGSTTTRTPGYVVDEKAPPWTAHDHQKSLVPVMKRARALYRCPAFHLFPRSEPPAQDYFASKLPLRYVFFSPSCIQHFYMLPPLCHTLVLDTFER